MSRKDKILNGNALYTFIAIIIGFVAGAVLLAVAGINPGLAYGKLLNGVFGQVKYITWSIVYAAPLILTGLSVAFSFRTGSGGAFCLCKACRHIKISIVCYAVRPHLRGLPLRGIHAGDRLRVNILQMCKFWLCSTNTSFTA